MYLRFSSSLGALVVHLLPGFALDPQFLHPAAQRAVVHAEQLRGAVIPLDLAVRQLQDVRYVLSFQVLERRKLFDESRDKLAGRERVVQTGEIGRSDDAVAAEHRGAFERVLELAHVPGPVVRAEEVHRLATDGEILSEIFLRKEFEEVVYQERDIFAAVLQVRKPDLYHVEPVIEVAAEAVFIHGFSELLLCRGEQSYVDDPALLAADGFYLPVLYHAEQFGLKGEWHLGDLVEQQCAAVGRLQQSPVRFDGAGEGALLVAEQLAFEERLGDGAAVYRHERLVAAHAVVVYRSGDHLFAGAAAAGDEYAGVGAGNFPDEGEDFLHRRSLAHYIVERELLFDLAPEMGHLLLEDFSLDGVANRSQQSLLAERLADVVERPPPHRLHRLVEIVGAADEYAGAFRTVQADPAQQIIDGRRSGLEYGYIIRTPLQSRERPVLAAADRDAVTLLLQRAHDFCGDDLAGGYDQYRNAGWFHGVRLLNH
jgi:hypothetical protein